MNWDYIAGWFDGEGSVHFKKRERQYMLSFPNTDYNVLKEILNFFSNLKINDINITNYKPHGNKNYKIMYRLIISRQKDVITILWYLKEKCITKKVECEKAYAYETTTYRVHKQRWKPEERLYIIENYKGYGDVVKIAKHLGRTYNSVENEVERLKVRDKCQRNPNGKGVVLKTTIG